MRLHSPPFEEYSSTKLGNCCPKSVTFHLFSVFSFSGFSYLIFLLFLRKNLILIVDCTLGSPGEILNIPLSTLYSQLIKSISEVVVSKLPR